MSIPYALSMEQSYSWLWQFKAVNLKDMWEICYSLSEDIGKFLYVLSTKIGFILTSKIIFNQEFLQWKCTRFPYREDVTNQWFDHSIPSGSEQEQLKKVRIWNVDPKERDSFMESIKDKTAKLPLSNEQYTLFYHGTNHESAENIMEDGIRLKYGGKELDFSDGEGFYVSDRFIDVHDWALQRYGAEDNAAVLVYYVDTNQMREQFKDLDLRSNEIEWKRVVKEYRGSQLAIDKPSTSKGRGKNRKSDPKYRKDLKEYDFIEGPMTAYRKRKYYLTYDKSSYQLCVRSSKGVTLFNQNLHSVVFF